MARTNNFPILLLGLCASLSFVIHQGICSHIDTEDISLSDPHQSLSGVTGPAAHHAQHFQPSESYSEVNKHVPVQVIEKIPLNIPHPVPVKVPNVIRIQIPEPYAVHVPIQQEIQVPTYRIVPEITEKRIPYTVEKPYPVEVEKPYPVEVIKQIKIAVPKPYPVPYTIYKHVVQKDHGW
uniref:DUF4794 domain-containing protein n=1 Tax=Stomoxys calcitrans TaxID=35570 RepID=A0A1I8PSB5_STOCA